MGPRCPDEYGVFLAPQAQTTRAVFLFNHNATGEGFSTKFAKQKIVSPTAMAKLSIDSDRLESLVINREICIPDREIFIILSKIGRSPAKSGELEALRKDLAQLPSKYLEGDASLHELSENLLSLV